MILINFGIQDGENEYTKWDWDTNFSKADYDSGKVKDFDLLQTMYGVEEDNLENMDNYCYSEGNMYWDNNRLVWVESVQDIDQPTLDILRRYV